MLFDDPSRSSVRLCVLCVFFVVVEHVNLPTSEMTPVCGGAPSVDRYLIRPP